MIENVNEVKAGIMGLYKPMSNGTTLNGAPVYETWDGSKLYNLGTGGWLVGPTHTSLWLVFKSPVCSG